MNVLLLDAKDSFVDIIAQYVRVLGATATVVRSDAIDADGIAAMNPDAILLGPGPGHPVDAGYVPIIRKFMGKTPILGICLGHQAIGLAFGAEVARAAHLMHGKSSSIEHDAKGVFRGLPTPFRATRYHSLIVDAATIPEGLVVTATAADDGYVMGLRAPGCRMESVQFHPESVTTKDGLTIFENFLQDSRS